MIKNSQIQSHHISYDPEITIDILKELHEEYHGHGTGPVKGSRKKHIHLMDRSTHINLSMPKPLLFLIETYLNKYGMFVTTSEFIRVAIKEKIERDTPILYKNMIRRIYSGIETQDNIQQLDVKT